MLQSLAFVGLFMSAMPAMAQDCPGGNPLVAPDSRYSSSEPVGGEFVVTDLATGLMWKRCSEGQSGADCTAGATVFLDWGSALTRANNAIHAGFSDWRLPNADELHSLVETGCSSPAINPRAFPNTFAGLRIFWSSTTVASSASLAWHIDFDNGNLGYFSKWNGLPVRLVRGGQWLDPFASEARSQPGDGTAPNTFSFAPQIGVPLSSVRTSEPITVTGLATVTGIGVTGAAGSSYSINGGTYTNLPGAVGDGAVVRVRHTSAAVLNTPATTTLSIGGVSANFVTTTGSAATEASTTTITADLPDPSVVGEAVPIEVSVTGDTTQPADGQVVVTASTGETCTDTTASAGSGTTALFSCPITFNSAGARNLTAVYSGSTTHDGSTSAAEPHQVDVSGATTTTITSVSTGTSAGLGQGYTVDVSVSASSTPVGTVRISDGYGARCGPVAVSGGTASCEIVSWQVGPKTLRAVFEPGPGFLASSDTEAFTVNSPGNDWLYIASYGDSLIRRARTNGSGLANVLSIANPRHIAYDPVNRHLFLGTCTSGGQLRRTNLDGSDLATLRTEGGCIYGVAVDPYARKVYWSNVDFSTSAIRRSNLDGSNVETIFSTANTRPAGIDLDLEAGKIYWGQFATGDYRRANLDGSGVENVISGLPIPNGVLVDAPANRVFLSNSDLSYTTLSGSPRTVLPLSVSFPVQMALDRIAGRLFVVNEGASRVGAIDTDGTDATDALISGPDRPIGMALVPAPDTTTSVISATSPNPSMAYAPVPITVTVTGAATRPVNGQVVVTASTGETCTDTTAAAGAGIAAEFSCALTFTTVGSRTISAVFSGATTHTGSTAAAVSHQVIPAATTTSITQVAPASISVGRPYWVAIEVSSAGGTPTGSVSVSDGFGARCGPVALSAAGTASCLITSHEPGPKTLRAVYTPTGVFTASSGSAPMSVTATDQWIYTANYATNQVRRFRLNGSSDQPVVSPAGTPTAIPAWDPVEQKIYYGQNAGAIVRINPDGSGSTTILSKPSTMSSRAFGLAIDPYARKIYWAEDDASPNHLIRRANLDGSGGEVIHACAGGCAPRGVRLDLEAGKVYWAETSNSRFRRANLDGSNVETVAASQSSAYDVALDAPNNRLFFTNYFQDTVYRAAFDWSGVTPILGSVSGASGMALDFQSSRLFVAQQQTGLVKVVNFDGTGSGTVSSPGGNITGIALASLWSPGEATTTVITSDVPDPSAVGTVTNVLVQVTGASTAPADGLVEVSAATGESCLGTTATPVSGATVSFTCALTFANPGNRTITARFVGSATHAVSTSAAEPHGVGYTTALTITNLVPATSQTVGVPYTVGVLLTGGVSPTGTVAVSDGAGASCSITLPGSNCTLTSATVGARTITANYSGDANHLASSDTESYTITASPGNPGGLQVGSAMLPATAASPAVNPTIRINFAQPFDAVPVVVVQLGNENEDPQLLRVRNITTTGFDILQVEPPGCTGCTGLSASTMVHWLAAMPGSYRLTQDTTVPAWLPQAPEGTGAGVLLKVGALATSATQYNTTLPGFSGWPMTTWDAVAWPALGAGLDFTSPPVVLTTMQGWANEGSDLGPVGLVGTSEPWATAVARNVSASGFEVAVEASGVSADDAGAPGFNTPETIGYVAIERNVSQLLVPLSGPPSVGLVTGLMNIHGNCDHANFSFPLGTTINAANFRGFAGKQTRNVVTGGWLRRCTLEHHNPPNPEIRIGLRRDTHSQGNSAPEGTPVTDEVGVAAFSGDLIATPVTLAKMSVARQGAGLVVDWVTGSQTAQLGFRLWGRATDGDWRLLTPVVPSSEPDTLSARSYRQVIADAGGIAEVRLEDVDVLGHSRFHPPIRVGQARGQDPVPSTIDWAAVTAENAARPPRPARSADAGVLARVRTSGVQRVPVADLIARDAAFDGAPAASLAVSDGGAAIPRHVSCATLAAGCTVEFLGEARDSRYGAENAYRLHLDPARARPVQAGHAQAGSGSARIYPATLEVRPNRGYSYSAPTEDPWFDGWLSTSGAPAQLTRSFSLPERQPGPVTLTVLLWGGLDFPGSGPDHHVQVLVNGQQLASRRFDGRIGQSIEVTVPESLLAASNTLVVRLPRDTGYSMDAVGLEGYRVSYPRRSQVTAGELVQGVIDPRAVNVGDDYFADGFEAGSSGAGFVIDGHAEGAVLWSVAEGNLRRDVLTAGPVRVVDRVEAWRVADPAQVRVPVLADPGAEYSLPASLDYLVVTHPQFESGLAPLLALQQSRGLATAVVRTDAVYARHSDHEDDPEAIRAVIAEAVARGARFVLLVGGDTFDHHNYLNYGSQSFVPAPYVPVSPIIFHAASDHALADVDGDGLAEVAIGRLPVRTGTELGRVIDSIVARGDVAATRHLGVAGLSEPNERFGPHMRAILSYLRQAGQERQYALADEIGTAAARTQAQAGLAGAADWVSYLGHSGWNRWAFDNLLDVSHLASITRNGLPAVVSQWSCQNNDFTNPTDDTMGHALMLRPNRLAATVVGATTVLEDQSQLALATRFFDLVEDGRIGDAPGLPVRTIGQALATAKRELVLRDPAHASVVYGVVLLGDPAAPLLP